MRVIGVHLLNITISLSYLFLVSLLSPQLAAIDSIRTETPPVSTTNSPEYDDEGDYYMADDELANGSNLTEIEFFPDEPVKVISDHDLYQLRRSLLWAYNPQSRPVENSSHPIIVKIGTRVAQINNLDEVYQVMTSTLQVTLSWRDELLKWNKSLFSSNISFKSHDIWTPDILAMNNVNNFKFENKETYLIGHSNNIFDFNEREKYLINVNWNGDCVWEFPMKLMSMCELDQQYFPFDVQKCFLEFRSSAHKIAQLKLVKHETGGVHLKLINEGEFDLIHASAENVEYTSHEEQSVRITLIMKRKMTFYFNKIILPYFVFYVVNIFTYIVPVDAGEKKSYSTSILISVMIYLKDVSNFIPKTRVLPMLSIYFNLNLLLVFFCIVASIFVYMVYFCEKTRRPLPVMVQNFVRMSSFSKCERQLNSTTTFDNHHLTSECKLSIKNELIEINRQLGALNKKIAEKPSNTTRHRSNAQLHHRPSDQYINSPVASSYTSSPTIASYMNKIRDDVEVEQLSRHVPFKTKLQNLVGIEMLNFLVDYKKLILKHSHAMKLAETQVVENKHLKVKELKRNVDNFHYMNTLEGIKNTMLNPMRWFKSQQKRVDPTSGHMFKSYHHLDVNINETPRNVRAVSVDNKSTTSQRNRNRQQEVVTRANEYLTTMKKYKAQLYGYLDIQQSKKSRKSEIKNKEPMPEHHLFNYNDEWKYYSIILDQFLFFMFSILIPVCVLIMCLKTMLL